MAQQPLTSSIEEEAQWLFWVLRHELFDSSPNVAWTNHHPRKLTTAELGDVSSLIKGVYWIEFHHNS